MSRTAQTLDEGFDWLVRKVFWFISVPMVLWVLVGLVGWSWTSLKEWATDDPSLSDVVHAVWMTLVVGFRFALLALMVAGVVALFSRRR